MIVVIDDREMVTEGYKGLFRREGFCCVGFKAEEFSIWASGATDEELSGVEAVLVAENNSDCIDAELAKKIGKSPRLALADNGNLETTLRLFSRGFDDVVKKPVHVREILARINAVRHRGYVADNNNIQPGLRIHLDGRDPEIDGVPLKLPRREQRILEYLASVNGRRVSRAQIFTATYGILEEGVEETVVESHISKLRKKLRVKLGYDPIDSKRYLGYRLALQQENEPEEIEEPVLIESASEADFDRETLEA
ncbi:response regulator transcription factor [Notoacmeibacter sp. MSK16QG-6]|uniref:response regulator transcription factor n=1 Tax=Notoacmeibacter sp. MSK16QG-6 TaxID=2957982 RepID=UPI0020A122A9|nr:response regulator transcription factor [Notoacmeibacter sp. MSK16QG-6]MCP1200934.1 response regulator transcription factor [Notoacmeibacter sp. MSK16QG-6]